MRDAVRRHNSDKQSFLSRSRYSLHLANDKRDDRIEAHKDGA
ncbi:hypothetical protein [Paenibacillus apiarius]